MNTRKWIAALALIALSAWAVTVLAQSKAQDGQRFNPQGSGTGSTSNSTVLVPQLIGGVIRADTSSKALTMDSNGYLYVSESAPARDDVHLFQNVIGPSQLANAAADSCAPIDVHRYRYMKLLIKAYLTNGASNATARLSFQFRENANSLVDSTNTFAEYIFTTTPTPAHQESLAFGVVAGQARLVTIPAIDTMTTGHLATGSATLPWSGEYTVYVSGNRGSPLNAVGAVAWSYPNGMSIPLDNVFGRPARFNQLSIRVRNMGTAAVNVTVSVLGFAE